MNNQFYEELCNAVEENRVRLHEKLSDHTSLHIGGPADYFVMPKSANEIKSILELCKKSEMPYAIIGNGSNLLVSDQGFRGLIINIAEAFSEIEVMEDGLVRARSGVLLSKLANVIARHSLTGFEFASGIPGTLGGAVTMNAGAYDGEMKDCLTKAVVMDEFGTIITLEKNELGLGYRTSILQKNNYILLEAELQLELGDKQSIQDKMDDLNGRRRDKQPLDQYSAGSTFKRPVGYFAGKLIADAGLRGYQVGGAAISEKHCGFAINKDNATAEDFITLINDVIRIVHDTYGVSLEPEVRYLGEFE